MSLLKKEILKPLSVAINILIFIGVFVWMLSEFLDNQHGLEDAAENVLYNLNKRLLAWWFLPFSLILVNWGLESKKWQLLASKLKPTSFASAFKGVLTGLSLSMVTPRSFGDYAGRVWQVDHSQRSALIGSVLLGRVAQMIPTLFFGCYGIYKLDGPLMLRTKLAILASTVLLLAFFLVKGRLSKLFARGAKYLYLLSEYSINEIILIVFWSFVRYLTFTSQFIIIMHLLGVNLPFLDLFAGTAFILLMKSFVPSFNLLTDVGIRELSALMFYHPYDASLEIILIATLIVWFINILIPSLVGSVFIFKMRIFNQK